jgi:hypothetical protein
MTGEAQHMHDAAATAYLQQMEALAAEIQIAMEAIASNALSRLQESVARQEMICATLASMNNVVGDGLRSAVHSLPRCYDVTVESRIQATCDTIRHLNLQYASLLKHSSKSIALLSMLCRSQSGQFQEDRGSRLKHQTWSCEM